MKINHPDYDTVQIIYMTATLFLLYYCYFSQETGKLILSDSPTVRFLIYQPPVEEIGMDILFYTFGLHCGSCSRHRQTR